MDKIIIIELNAKNILILIYKLLFYMKNREYIINKIQFINNIYKFIDYYLSNTKFLFLKILFPIEEYQSTLSNTKLIIEIIY